MNCTISVDGNLHRDGSCGLGDGQRLVFRVWPFTSKAAEGTVYHCSLLLITIFPPSKPVWWISRSILRVSSFLGSDIGSVIICSDTLLNAEPEVSQTALECL